MAELVLVQVLGVEFYALDLLVRVGFELLADQVIGEHPAWQAHNTGYSTGAGITPL